MHSLDELVELRFAINQDLLVRDGPWNLHREDEISWGLLVPICDRRSSGSAVECAVDLDRLKLAGIVTEKILRAHADWIERAFPSCRRKRRSAKKDGRQRKRAFVV